MTADSPFGDVGHGPLRRRQAQGVKADALQETLVGLDPGLAEWADTFVFGEVWGRPGISQEERMLVAITALAVGGHTNQLRTYIHGALQAGVSAQKIHEALVMLVVYAGFPTAVQALVCCRDVVASERRRGLDVDM